MKSQLPEDSVLEGILDALDNNLARRRVLDRVLKFRDEIGIPKAAYDFVGSKRTIVDGLAKLELIFFLPAARKVQPGTAVVGGDLELTINVWVMVIDDNSLKVLRSNKKLVDDVEHCEVHVLAPISENLTGVVW